MGKVICVANQKGGVGWKNDHLCESGDGTGTGRE